MEPDDWGKVDIFIDDDIVTTPDLHSNRDRAVPSLLLALHALCRPTDPSEPIAREDCLSLGKLAEEGQLSECFTVLGWDIDTRCLTIALPKKKFSRWDKELGEIIACKKVSFALLETTVGRLNHAASACPVMRYFLSRIHLALSAWDISRKTKKVEHYSTSQVLDDLRLWKKSFLPAIQRGMSLNLITYRRHSFLCWSDAYPMGLGGFVHRGFAWRWQIPPEFQNAVKNKNNCLEFIASIITIWQAILDNWFNQEECFLSLGDNSSSIGWLHKASIDPTKNSPLFLAARKFAKIILTNNVCIYSQHIPGVSNKIVDALSRRFDLNDEQLTSLINSSSYLQVHSSFRICQIHPEINSWMIYWLQKCSAMKESHRTQRIKKIGCGNNGLSMQKLLDSVMMYGCQDYNQNTELTSLELLQPLSDGENFLAQTKKAWLLQQSKRPWQNWLRCLGQTCVIFEPWNCSQNAHLRTVLHCSRFRPHSSRW